MCEGSEREKKILEEGRADTKALKQEAVCWRSVKLSNEAEALAQGSV